MMRLPAILLAAVLALAASPAPARGQSPAPADPLQRGRALLTRLSLSPAQDAAVFASLPAGEPETLLTAVLTAGQGYQSDPRLWPDMHRAASALVELALYRKQEFKAAIYASMQAMLYRTYDNDYAAALEASRQALAFAQKYAPPALLPSYVSDVGEALIRVGRADEGLEYLRRAHEASTGRYDAFTATNWRAIVLADIGRRDLKAAADDAAAFVAAAAPDTPPVFRGLAHLAASDVAMERGDYPAMLASVHKALDAAGSDQAASIAALGCVSQLLEAIVAATTALPYPDAIALARRIGTEFPSLPIPVEAFAEATIRRRRRAAGDLDAMLREDDDAVRRARAGGNAADIAEALLDESLDYAWLNAARQSATLLEEASTLLAGELAHATYPGSEGLAHLRLRVLTNLGLAYADEGELERASAAWDEIGRVLDSIPAGMARQQLESARTDALVGKARVAELEDDPAQAATLLRQALPRVQRSGGPSRSEVLNDLARVDALAEAEPAGVEKTYADAVAAAADEKDVDFETTIRLNEARFLTIGPGHALPDAASIAERELTRAQADADALHLATSRWKVEYGFGLLEEGRGRIDQAITRYTSAASMVDAMRSTLSLDENRQSLVDDKNVQELYARLVSLLIREGRRQDAWTYLERDKARSFSEMLRARRVDSARPRETSGPLADLEQRIVRLKLELAPANVGLLRGSGRDPAALGSELQTLTSQYELALDSERLKEGRRRTGGAVATLPDVQAHLPAGASLLEYTMLPDAVAVFVVRRGGAEVVHTAADGVKLRRDLLKLRRALSTPGGAAEADTLARRVSASLVAPLESRLAGVTRLIVIPAGAMNYVPYQVLRLADGRQMVDAFTISNLPSASTVPLLAGAGFKEASVFAGAIGQAVPKGWAPLPATTDEARAIAGIFPRATLATGTDFRASRVLAALGSDDVVHLATHGDLDDQAPLFSALITSPSDGEPGRLPLYRLAETRVHAKLVVLSACQTATGKLLGGDEVTSLTRTLIVSGANAVVSTLWNVDDRVTAELMKAFYGELAKGRTPADALRRAELAVRAAHPEPSYWAPFVSTSLE